MIITSKYNGTCAACGGGIRKGERIDWERGKRPNHATCGQGRSVAITFGATGATMYQNSRGRCEDAPCCGCCS